MRLSHGSASRDGDPHGFKAAGAVALAALGVCGTAAAPSLASADPDRAAAAMPIVATGDGDTLFTYAPGNTSGDEEEAAEGARTPKPARASSGGSGDQEYLYLAGVAGLGLLFGGAGSGGRSATSADFAGPALFSGSAPAAAADEGGDRARTNRSAPAPGGSDSGDRNGADTPIGTGAGSRPTPPGEVVFTPPSPPGAPGSGDLPLAGQPSFGGGGSAPGTSGGGSAPGTSGGGSAPGTSGGGNDPGGIAGVLLPPSNPVSRPPVSVEAVPEPGAVATLLIFGSTLGVGMLRGRRHRHRRTSDASA